MAHGPSEQPISDQGLALLRRDAVTLSTIPSSDVRRVLARLDQAEGELQQLRSAQTPMASGEAPVAADRSTS